MNKVKRYIEACHMCLKTERHDWTPIGWHIPHEPNLMRGPTSITAHNLVGVFVSLFFVCIKLLGNVCESVP